MEALINDSHKKLSLLSKTKLLISFLLMPRIKITEPYSPFKSKLKKHSIQRDKDAVAFHYDISNNFFQTILSDNML